MLQNSLETFHSLADNNHFLSQKIVQSARTAQGLLQRMTANLMNFDISPTGLHAEILDEQKIENELISSWPPIPLSALDTSLKGIAVRVRTYSIRIPTERIGSSPVFPAPFLNLTIHGQSFREPPQVRNYIFF